MLDYFSLVNLLQWQTFLTPPLVHYLVRRDRGGRAAVATPATVANVGWVLLNLLRYPELKKPGKVSGQVSRHFQFRVQQKVTLPGKVSGQVSGHLLIRVRQWKPGVESVLTLVPTLMPLRRI